MSQKNIRNQSLKNGQVDYLNPDCRDNAIFNTPMMSSVGKKKISNFMYLDERLRNLKYFTSVKDWFECKTDCFLELCGDSAFSPPRITDEYSNGSVIYL